MNLKVLVLLMLFVFLVSSCSVLTVPVVVQFDSSCDWQSFIEGEPKFLLEGEKYVVVGTELTENELADLKEEECVLRAGEKSDVPMLVKKIQSDLNSERDEMIKEANLDRTLKKDILDKDDLQNFVEQENPEIDWPSGVISPYQLYVKPDLVVVQSLAVGSVQDIYDNSLEWVWISDDDLHGVVEEWLYPGEFLLETDGYGSNPTGEVASDCEEQANTLASILIASGYSAENVRVVLGLVDFDGVVGGHAWVQVYEDGRWFDVEATSGAYYTDESGYVPVTWDIPYDYFKYYTYPSIEIWYYYNNDYFLNVEMNQGNAPPFWKGEGGSWLEDDLEGFQEFSPGQGKVVYPLRR